jgi:spore germination protein GerM
MTARRRRSSIALVLIATAALLTGCSIQPEAGPNDLPQERQDVFGEPDTGEPAAGTNRIFLLAPADPEQPQRLRSVLRDVSTEASALLASLFSGPNEQEREAQLDTAVPADALLLDTNTVGGRVTVDVNDVFDELTPDGLRLAVAQIVITATGLDDIESVVLRIDGEPTLWPLGNGELVERPLTAFDYPGLVESTQPPFPAIPSPSR